MTNPRDARPLADAEALFARPWRFLKSVPSLEFLPPADRVEIALAGRSNVGKSSLVNALLGHGGMARTSNTPGRTQELNFFLPDDADLYLVDMPGYGFAKAPKDKVETWTALVRDYLRGRATLARTLLLIDSRHGLKPVDGEIMKLLDEAAVTYQVVLTKSDKISDLALAHTIETVQLALETHPAAYPTVLATSAVKGRGIAELRAEIADLVRERSAR